LERRELDALPDRIEQLETEQAKLYRLMAEPDFYRHSGADIKETNERLQAVGTELDQAYQRWEDLDSIESASSEGLS
jgi:ATP-binding cassette subfamily F protein uup